MLDMGMILYILVTVVTVMLAYGVKREKQQLTQVSLLKRGSITRRQGINILSLSAIFVILFLLSAFRMEVGNDYETYVDTIHEIYVGGYVVTEPLFNLVVKILCFLSGGENYLLVFAVFAFVTVWLFLKVLYEQSEDFFGAFFLFMTMGIYFRTFNTVRYYFVLAVTLYSFRYVLRKEYGKFILLICLAALFHKSVLVVIPLYLAAAIPWKKRHIVLLGTSAAALLIFQDVIMKIALELYPSYKDTVFLETETGLGGNLMSILRCLVVLVLSLLSYRESVKGKKENEFYFKLNILAIVIYISCSFLPLVGRIGYYLMTSHILFLPSVIANIRQERKKKLLGSLVLLAGIFYFVLFLNSADQAGVRVLPYKSWLFYEKEFLNAETIF